MRNTKIWVFAVFVLVLAWCGRDGTRKAFASGIASVVSVFGQTGVVNTPVTTTDISTPSNPSAGNTTWYTKAGTLCALNPSGGETCTGSGGGGGSPAGASLFSTTNSTTVTAASAATLIGTVVGSTTVAANTFTAGSVMEVLAQGYYSTPAAARTLTINLNIGGTTRITTGAVTVIASVTNGTWLLHCGVTTRTTGGSGTQIANCVFQATGTTLTAGDQLPMQTSSTWTTDTTTTQAVDLQAAWDATTGTPTITSTNVAAWIVGGGPTANQNIRSVGAGFDGGGTALTSGATSTSYFTVPFACTIAAWNITVDTGTISFDVWKVATGTAIPTSGNTILSGGFLSIASGTAIHSTSLTDFTSTTVSANDIFGVNIEAVSSATKASLVIQCNAS